MDLNNISLTGRLTDEPDLRYTENEVAVCNFTIAVERNYKNRSGERDVDFIKIVVWRKLAELCAENLGTGRRVAVDGALQINKSEREDKVYYNPEVIADDVIFLDWPKNKKQKKKGA